MATDAGRKETDKALEQLEKRITKQYDRAAREVEKKLNNYLQSFAQKDREKAKLVKKGQLSEREYAQWRQGQIMIGERWKEMRDTLAKDLTNADKIAANMINESLPNAYAISHNYGTYEAEKGALVNTSYTLYDRDTVKRLIKDDPDLLPDPKVDIPKDLRWNREHINAAVTQGILQGEDIGKIAGRLRDVTDMDKNAAIRNARTMTTAAENAGRTDSYKRAENMGIKITQVWIAAIDSRTRDAHRELDGQERPVGEPFQNSIGKILYPGDPHADPANVYNCRCTIIAKVKGIDLDAADMSLRDSRLGDMTYQEWKKQDKKRENESVLSQEEIDNEATNGIPTLSKKETYSETIASVNPLWETKQYEWMNNCANCVVANEMRIRGYDVTADRRYKNKNIASFWYDNSYGKGSWTDSFSGVKGELVGATRKNQQIAKISQKMKEYGNGSRAVVFVTWDWGGGHYFSVQNVDGKIVFTDAQSNRIGERVEEYFEDSRPSKTRVFRIDDKKIMKFAKDVVKYEGDGK